MSDDIEQSVCMHNAKKLVKIVQLSINAFKTRKHKRKDKINIIPTLSNIESQIICFLCVFMFRIYTILIYLWHILSRLENTFDIFLWKVKNDWDEFDAISITACGGLVLLWSGNLCNAIAKFASRKKTPASIVFSNIGRQLFYYFSWNWVVASKYGFRKILDVCVCVVRLRLDWLACILPKTTKKKHPEQAICYRMKRR